MSLFEPGCVFCKIAESKLPAARVFEDSLFMAFLDMHPLFPGHVLLCPRDHYETLPDLPAALVGPLFLKAQVLAESVRSAVKAEGTFIAINNVVSQSVPHLHIHVVPRKRKDGLKGFFWPKNHYKDEAEQEAIRIAIEREMQTRLAS